MRRSSLGAGSNRPWAVRIRTAWQLRGERDMLTSQLPRQRGELNTTARTPGQSKKLARQSRLAIPPDRWARMAPPGLRYTYPPRTYHRPHQVFQCEWKNDLLGESSLRARSAPSVRDCLRHGFGRSPPSLGAAVAEPHNG